MLQAFAQGALFGERYGEGAPYAVCLHGWRRSSADFRDVLGPGVNDAGDAVPIDAVALDLPGFGSAPPPPEPWGSRDYAEALSPLLDELGPVVVLGHSFGGRVAIELADRRPDAVRALVLTGVPLLPPLGSPPRPKLVYRAIREARRRGLVSEERLERARQRYGSDDYRQASGVMRAVLVNVLGERYDDLLQRLELPVDLVWGERDAVAPLEAARRAAHLFPQASLRIVPGGDHLLPVTAPAEIRAALLARRP